MAKPPQFEVLLTGSNPELEQDISSILREQHGVHGVTIVNDTNDGPSSFNEPDLIVDSLSENEVSFCFRGLDEKVHIEKVERSLKATTQMLSKIAIQKLQFKDSQQSSREDYARVVDYRGDKPNLASDPSIWVFNNPFIHELSRQYPKYGNLLRFLCNERGLFIKAANYPAERAYWNSTTNGGLPIVRKADPIHEGTFMLHDLFHFVPTDPILGTGEVSHEERSVYIAHRLLSEACTLVLADMVAVADSNIKSTGYDTNKRKIFPVYESIQASSEGRTPSINKLMAANAYFCFTGDPKGFKILGASDESLEEFQEKYESIFRDDFLWNLANFDAMEEEKSINPELEDYYSWIEANTSILTLSQYMPKVRTSDGVDIAQMLSLFRADFSHATSYPTHIIEYQRIALAFEKYLAGQRIVFARYANTPHTQIFKDEFDRLFFLMQGSHDTEAIKLYGNEASMVTDKFIDKASKAYSLTPHEVLFNKFSAPLYPVKFVNYERNRLGSDNLSKQLQSFTELNKKQLERLIETVSAPD